MIAERMDVVDPDAIHASRESLRAAIGSALPEDCSRRMRPCRRGSDLRRAPRAFGGCAPSRSDCLRPRDRGRAAALAKAQFDGADNMTDRQGALGILVSLDAPERQEALDAFYERFQNDALVLDKWFAIQAAAQRPDTRSRSLRLATHPDFMLTNPNRLRSLVGHVRRQPLGVPHAPTAAAIASSRT